MSTIFLDLTMLQTIGALLILTILAFLCGILLGFANQKFKVKADPLVDQIDALLPQTQCGQCGYPGCRPYAVAISDGDEINKCSPGGQNTINQIANLLGVDPSTTLTEQMPMVAVIDEAMCIGCTKCIQACPVDAIVGAARSMHTVITKDCTGCKLCIAPCPTDCIKMIPIKTTIDNWLWDFPLAEHNVKQPKKN